MFNLASIKRVDKDLDVLLSVECDSGVLALDGSRENLDLLYNNKLQHLRGWRHGQP